MLPGRPFIFLHCRPRRQHGAALMVMLVILVIGAATILVSSLSGATLQIERDKITADALAQAKAALIGKSLIYDDYPGSLPCPDTSNDGVSDAGGSEKCPSYIGRLPWKTLGLPDLRDSAGERLWYTLSRNVRRYDSVRPLNSETTGTLNITGTYTANNLIAIVFAPGANTGNQSRSESQMAPCTTTGNTRAESRCAANYLEGSNANPSTGTTRNQNYKNSDVNIPFNDQLISISHDQLFQQVEKRVAREVRQALLSFYRNNHYYPYASLLETPGVCADGNLRGFLPVTGSGSSCTPLPTFPAWFTANGWEKLMYYTLSGKCSQGTDNCNGTTGAFLSILAPNSAVIRNDVHALVISTGRAIITAPFAAKGSAQVRPPNNVNVNDYLDSAENIDADDDYNKAPNDLNYNDWEVVVAP